MHIPQFPKNMHPVHNQERRQARAKALQKRYENSEDVVCMDTDDYIDRDAMALAVVNRQGDSIASCSFRTLDWIGTNFICACSWALARPDEGLRRLRGCRYSARVPARRCQLAGSLPFERLEDLLDGPELLVLIAAFRGCL